MPEKKTSKPKKIHVCHEPSYRDLLSYYTPLAFQAISQSLTYPLVAIVAARGDAGPLNIAAMAQASIVLFFLMTICAGLLTTGMIYCVNREGLEHFKKLNFRFTALIVSLHIFFCNGFSSEIIFQSLLGLNPDLFDPTYLAFVLFLPYSLLFNSRNVATVVLFNKKLTGRAYSATLIRIILTVLFSIILVSLGFVGIIWAVICQSIPLLIETIIINRIAKPYIRELKNIEGRSAPLSEMTLFTLSFSSGKVLLAFSSYIIAAFAARAAYPEVMLPIYYAVIGLFNPFVFAATRTQALVISHGLPKIKNKKLFSFSVLTGLVMGIVPLIFIIPPISEWYYCGLQKIPKENIKYLVQTSLFLSLIPLAVAIRSYAEGWAASFKKPMAVIAGQGVYLGAVVSAAFFAFNAGTQGNLIGPIALLFGNIFAAAILFLSLKLKEPKAEIQAPPPPVIMNPT